MGLHTILPNDLLEVDVIIVGGGTAGCIVASRLADAGPALTVLIIENGPNNQDLPEVVHPALYKGSFQPESKIIQRYFPKAERQLSNRTDLFLASGSTLGGGSSVNGMIYTRPQRVDFDSWGTKGWSADDLIPFLERFETYHGRGSKVNHGDRGPVHVSYGRYQAEDITNDFIDAMNQVGYSTTEDLQDLSAANAVAPALRYVSPEDGSRQNAASAYLHPRLKGGKHPNLHVLVGSEVIRILAGADKEVKGVEYRSNPNLATDPTANLTQTINARKLVVLSAGTHKTPTILERSGIGNPDVLEKAGIPVLHKLPGVGHSYEDHQMVLYTYKSNLPPGDTTESIFDGSRDVGALLAANDGFLSWNGVDASAKIRPSSEDINNLSAAFSRSWKRDFEDVPTKPLAMVFLVVGILDDPTLFLPGQFFTLATYLAYPYSRGHIHITGPSIDDPVDLATGYLADDGEVDLEAQIWLYKKQREVARRMKFYQGETHRHPVFAPDSKAAAANLALGEDSTQPEVKYTKQDDESIAKWIREHVGTAFHSIGSCKMAPVENLGVVDKDLNVHGLKKLKVADLSIVPKNVSGNTMSTALLIGEKAADIVISELGLA